MLSLRSKQTFLRRSKSLEELLLPIKSEVASVVEWFPEHWTGMGDYCSSWTKAQSSSFRTDSMPTLQEFQTSTALYLQLQGSCWSASFVDGRHSPVTAAAKSQIPGTAACPAHTDEHCNSEFSHCHLPAFCFECKWTFEWNLEVVPGVYRRKSNIAWAHRSLAITNSFASLSFLYV